MLAVAGCATLPDLKDFRRGDVQRQNREKLLDTRNVPSQRQAKRIVEKLERGGEATLLRRHLGYIEAINGPPLVVGNSARLLIDGPATFDAMFSAIQRARHHVNLETYIIDDGVIGLRLADLLIAKRRQGVEINIIYDSVGSILTPSDFFERLRSNDIKVCEFNPVNPLKGRRWRINNRDHRKILIVDGETAFTGGINISGVYSAGSVGSRRKRASTSKEGWRDTHVQIDGPAVAEFQHLFVDTWERKCGAPLAQSKFFPNPPAKGDKIISVMGSSPDDPLNLTYIVLLSAIAHAEKSVYLTMAYFVPDPQTIDTLKAAARRGVDVKLILPGFSDFGAVFHAGRSHYSDLLGAGVKIFEHREALLHAKTAVIDGVWSTVGSTNMDWRSFLHNDEVNGIVIGEEFANEMERMFNRDLSDTVPIELAKWEARSPLLKMKEWGARMWEYWL
ncbi:MAG: phospholipase D-like domain-containing protein [Burkholderiales bacterium]